MNRYGKAVQGLGRKGRRVGRDGRGKKVFNMERGIRAVVF